MIAFIGYFCIVFFALCAIFTMVQIFSEEFPKWKWACFKMKWHMHPITGDKESLCPRCKQKVEWKWDNSQWMTDEEYKVYVANISSYEIHGST